MNDTHRGARRMHSTQGDLKVPRRAGSRASLTKSISFTTPVDMQKQLRAAAQEHDTTLTQLVLNAIEENSSQLAELVAAEKPPANVTGALFPQPENLRNRRQEPRVATSLRISSINLKILDDLVEKHDAANRSQLITAALRAYINTSGNSDA